MYFIHNFTRFLLGPLTLLVIFAGCDNKKSKWVFDEQITLPEETRPLAIAASDNHFLWVSDPQNYRILKINRKGKIVDSIANLKRPMNIDVHQEQLFIPAYHTDSIWRYANAEKQPFQINTKLQSPTGLHVHKDTIAVADFFNHRIVLQVNGKIRAIGKKGHKQGQLYYPIDVKIHNERIYVADAYNHRVQIFKNNGKFLREIGTRDTLKVASGIDVTQKLIAITDQEHDRVMLYNHEGKLLQRLQSNINYPTDVLLLNDSLFITNFTSHTLTVFVKKES